MKATLAKPLLNLIRCRIRTPVSNLGDSDSRGHRAAEWQRISVKEPQERVPKQSYFGHEAAAETTKSRLIDTLLAIWADSPAESLSVRALVQQAGTAHASIHYHFGDMKRLYLAASQVALDQARGWMDSRLAAVAPLAGRALPAPVQAAMLAATLADWAGSQRRLAMAARHAPGAAWQTASMAFWSDLAALLGLSDYAATIALFASGETARHLLVWNPVLDRALLDETTTALVLWLVQRRHVPDQLRPLHRELARDAYHGPAPHSDARAAAIQQAAAALLAEQGHAGVTFRAVARRAGVTLGQVIHLCGSKSELLRGALHQLYEREALGGDPAEFMAQSIAPQVMLDHLLDAVLAGNQPVLRAYDEIELAICNGQEFAALRGMVRSMDDPSGTWALQQMLGSVAPPAALVAAYSAIIRGIGYQVQHAALPPAMLRQQAHTALMPFLGEQ
jgi:AcrR family transcriptional regulator